jgi:3-hydroxymyristoyl/3-hydroxydecanoyl-(acyl carrier protein) dehydratase
MPQSATYSFPNDHPSGAGHFPGNPIIPGALLLDAMLEFLPPDPSSYPMTLHTAKFLHIVRPGETVDFSWQDRPGGKRDFECRLRPAGTLVMTGTLSLACPAP